MTADALLAAATVHLGFQLTVTAVVYPALARVPAGQWAKTHRAHTGAITPLVVLVYGLLALSGGWGLLAGPDAWTLAAVAAGVVAVLVTVSLAAPLHLRLGRAYDKALVRRLLHVDRVRTVAAAACALAAYLAA